MLLEDVTKARKLISSMLDVVFDATKSDHNGSSVMKNFVKELYEQFDCDKLVQMSFSFIEVTNNKALETLLGKYFEMFATPS